MLRSIDWYLVIDVSGQPILPIFNIQAAQEEFFLNCLRNIPEERRYQRTAIF
jgi:hypothetical protein